MVKRLVNIFLVVILSIQMLPVKEMGRALFNNLFNEEIPHSLDVEKDCVKKIQGKSEFIDWHQVAVPVSGFIELAQPQQPDVAIPHNHSIEILVPPPNC